MRKVPISRVQGKAGPWRTIEPWRKGDVPLIPRGNLAIQHTLALLDAAETVREWNLALGQLVQLLFNHVLGPDATEAECGRVSAIAARIMTGHIPPARRPSKEYQARTDAMLLSHFTSDDTFGEAVRYLGDFYALTKVEAQRRVRRVEESIGQRFRRAPQGRKPNRQRNAKTPAL